VCPTTFLLQSLLVLVLGYFVFIWSQGHRNATENFNQLISLLDDPKLYSKFFGWYLIIKGSYKGREVGWDYFCLKDDIDAGSSNITSFYIKPNCVLKKGTDGPYLNSASIQYLQGGRLYFTIPRRSFSFGSRMTPFVKEELTEMLETLTNAAMLLEKNPQGTAKGRSIDVLIKIAAALAGGFGLFYFITRMF
jgi:hypothetical protein